MIAAVACGALQAQADLVLTPGDPEPSIRWMNKDIAGSLKPRVSRVLLATPNGDLTESQSAGREHAEPRPGELILQQVYNWGTFNTIAKEKKGAIEFTVTIHNNATTLAGVELDVLSLKLPQKPTGWEWPHLSTNIDEPGIIFADCGDLKVACCNDDTLRPLRLGFGTALDADKKTWQIEVDTGRRKNAPPFYPFIDRPVFPQKWDSFKFYLRFGGKDATRTSLAGDVLEKYRKAFPYELKWPDRRPIGALMIASSETTSESNPRGWLQDKTIDTRTPEGRAKLKERLLKYADGAVAEMKKTNAQGMILWDPEGQEFPHAISYIGDPRWLPPESDAVMDEFFKKFTDAGLKVGVCIRPQMPVKPAYGGSVFQMDMRDVEGVMKAKIEAAKKRWGCTLFYVDSNIEDDARGRVVHAAQIYRNLAKAFPDILLIPEHEYARHYAYTAPYNEVRGKHFSTPQDIRELYPEAFSVLYVADGPVEENKAALTEAVKRGDILLFRGWYDDPLNEKVREIYKAAGK